MRKTTGYFSVTQTMYWLKWSCDNDDTQEDNC